MSVEVSPREGLVQMAGATEAKADDTLIVVPPLEELPHVPSVPFTPGLSPEEYQAMIDDLSSSKKPSDVFSRKLFSRFDPAHLTHTIVDEVRERISAIDLLGPHDAEQSELLKKRALEVFWSNPAARTSVLTMIDTEDLTLPKLALSTESGPLLYPACHLGKGSFAVVHVVEVSTDRRGELHVLKRLSGVPVFPGTLPWAAVNQDDSGQRDAVSRFNGEADILKCLTDAGLVNMLALLSRRWTATESTSTGEVHTPCIEYEFRHGVNLEDFHTKGGMGKLLGREAFLIMGAQLAASVCEMHREGVIHRDLKPQNIVVPADGKGMLPVDFGLALRANQSGLSGGARNTQQNTMLGTLAYMAPEQIADAMSVDSSADVFSLALVYHYLRYGRHVFEGSLQEVLSARRSEIPPKQLLKRFVDDPKIPQDILELLKEALDPNPLKRPTAQKILEAFLSHTPFAGLSAGQYSERIKRGEAGVPMPPEHLERLKQPDAPLPSGFDHHGSDRGAEAMFTLFDEQCRLMSDPRSGAATEILCPSPIKRSSVSSRARKVALIAALAAAGSAAIALSLRKGTEVDGTSGGAPVQPGSTLQPVVPTQVSPSDPVKEPTVKSSPPAVESHSFPFSPSTVFLPIVDEHGVLKEFVLFRGSACETVFKQGEFSCFTKKGVPQAIFCRLSNEKVAAFMGRPVDEIPEKIRKANSAQVTIFYDPDTHRVVLSFTECMAVFTEEAGHIYSNFATGTQAVFGDTVHVGQSLAFLDDADIAREIERFLSTELDPLSLGDAKNPMTVNRQQLVLKLAQDILKLIEQHRKKKDGQ